MVLQWGTAKVSRASLTSGQYSKSFPIKFMQNTNICFVQANGPPPPPLTYQQPENSAREELQMQLHEPNRK